MLLDLYDFQCFSYIYSVFSCFLLVAQTRFLVFYSVSTHCCMLSERFLKNLALLRRNAFLLRSTCLLYDLLLPRLDLLVLYSVFRRSPYLRIFSRFSNNCVFRVFPVHCTIFNVFPCRNYSSFIVFSRQFTHFQQTSRGSYTFCVFKTRLASSVSKEL